MADRADPSGTVRPVTDTHLLRIGGDSREEVLRRLETGHVQLNELARTFLSLAPIDRTAPRTVQVTVRTVAALGLAQGATLPQVLRAARAVGLGPCPAEVGPALRLLLREQPDAPDRVMSQGRAPSGSLTVASDPLGEDDALPRGLYLRTVEGVDWLRGYRCDDEHLWSPEDAFVLQVLQA